MDLESVKTLFLKDRFASECCGIEILSATPGNAVCEMKICDRHLNAGGVVQGGAIFTLGDFTYAVAANCGGIMSVTLDTNTSFVAPATGTLLRAHAVERSASNRLCFYDVLVTDENDTLVAKLAITGFKKGPIDLE